MTGKYWRWKLRRELHRIKQQLASIPEFVTEPRQRQRHDAWRAEHLRACPGHVAQRSKVALLLIFQPGGVSPATRWTCEHLVGKGYAPLVISNARLSAADRDLLAPWVWQMAERPNFGYDFGGYRDGVWLLQQWQVDPEALLIMNDSIWFPLYPDEVLIDRMERHPATFLGALQLDPLRDGAAAPAKKRPFFGSFMLMVKRAAWSHPAFVRFWAEYRITSNKYKTIRRGERGFSHALMDAGISSAAIYSRADLDRYLGQLPNAALRDLLPDLVSIDERIEAALDGAVRTYADSPQWRALALPIARAATEKQNILATAPVISLATFQVPYLKKSKDWNNVKALGLLRQKFQSGALPRPHPAVMAELDDALAR